MKPLKDTLCFKAASRGLAPAALAVLLAFSCSIKEDRVGCPCILRIYPDKSLDADYYLSIMNKFRIMDVQTGEIHLKSALDAAVFAKGEPAVFTIPKGNIEMLGIFGIEEMKDEGTALRIKEGGQADKVLVYGNALDCTGEMANDTLKLAKQWCTMRISVKKTESGVPGKCQITSHWDGFDLMTLSPTKGGFTFDADTLQEGNYSVRLPRQGDSSLALRLIYDKEETGTDYPIGRLISEAGYDWNKKSLDDLVVYIDRSDVSIGIVVAGWENGKDYGNIEI